MRLAGALILGLVLLPCYSLADPRVVTVWNYHDFPPFAVRGGLKTCLSTDLTNWLTKASGGRYEFRLKHIPRKRLNSLRDEGKSGIVLWANPVWFDDPDRKRFLWTPPLTQDRDIIISHIQSGFEYEGPHSLKGKRIAVVRGYHFPRIAPLVEEGDIERVDIARESNGLRMLVHERPIDATLMSGLAGRYIASQLHITDELNFSDPPLRHYDRHLMVTPDLPEVAEFLRQAISRLHGSPEWRRMREAYGITTHPAHATDDTRTGPD